MSGDERPSKVCAVCGRSFTWRRKWARDWDDVRYCSARCRRDRSSERGDALEAAVLRLLDARSADATICPSEVARATRPDDWRPLMPDVRRAAARLGARGDVEITQRGRVVDPATARGPIRIRRRHS